MNIKMFSFMVILFFSLNLFASNTFDITPLFTKDGDEILTFSCTEKGDKLDCLRSRVNFHKYEDTCKVTNILVTTEFIKIAKNTWSIDLPVRVDTLKKEGEVWIFTEAEKKDSTHPNPPVTVYSNKDRSKKRFHCPNISVGW